METKTRISITDMTTDGAISVLTQTYIEFNGQETILENHREALVPGQFERLRALLPENQYKAVEALWTDEVITTWNEKQAQYEAHNEG